MATVHDRQIELEHLDAVSRDQAMFQCVENDDAQALSRYLENYPKMASPVPGEEACVWPVSPLIANHALSRDAADCIALLLPRLDPVHRNGIVLSRVVEKDNLTGLKRIEAAFPLSKKVWLSTVLHAVKEDSRDILAHLLTREPLPGGCDHFYEQAMDRRHLECLRLLLHTQHPPSPSACLASLRDACARRQTDFIQLLLPFADLPSALVSAINMADRASGVFERLDAVCEEFLPARDFVVVGQVLLSLPDPSALMPHTHSRIVKAGLVKSCGSIALPVSTRHRL